MGSKGGFTVLVSWVFWSERESREKKKSPSPKRKRFASFHRLRSRHRPSSSCTGVDTQNSQPSLVMGTLGSLSIFLAQGVPGSLGRIQFKGSRSKCLFDPVPRPGGDAPGGEGGLSCPVAFLGPWPVCDGEMGSSRGLNRSPRYSLSSLH